MDGKPFSGHAISLKYIHTKPPRGALRPCFEQPTTEKAARCRASPTTKLRNCVRPLIPNLGALDSCMGARAPPSWVGVQQSGTHHKPVPWERRRTASERTGRARGTNLLHAETSKHIGEWKRISGEGWARVIPK